MKRILTLPGCPQGLADYLADGDDPANWDGFRNDDREAYRELRCALAKIQHGLCAYCESSLPNYGTQVDHVIPKNARTGEPARALDYTNLIACCSGIAQRVTDAGRWEAHESCGQAKGETNSPDFIDPRKLPALPGLLQVRLEDGEITPIDELACRVAGFSKRSISCTIEILGLNVPRLKRERLSRINDLYEVAEQQLENFDAPEFIENWARQELLPDSKGILPDFFTTARSYFGELAELILDEPPQAWI